MDLSTKPPIVTLSRFRSGLRKDLYRDFFARGICDIEYAYQIVWDLDVLRESYFQGNLDYKRQSTKSNSERSQYKNNPNTSIQKEDDKWKWHVESVPGPTIAFNVINARAMVIWRRFVPVNLKSSIWVSNNIKEDTQKKVVYLGNEGSDSDDATE